MNAHQLADMEMAKRYGEDWDYDDPELHAEWYLIKEIYKD